MEYRWNKYLTVKEEDEWVTLFNPFNYAMVKSPKKIKKRIDDELASEHSNFSMGIYKELLDKGMIVENDFREEQLVEALYIQNNHNNDVLDLLIFLTLDCNFACRYCFEKHEKVYIDEKMQDAIIKFVRKNIKSYGGLQISWFGGEPLLAIDTIERMTAEFKKICKDNKKSYLASMTTNGSLLNYDNYLRMKKCGVYSYQITIDGVKKSHDSQRFFRGGKGSFDIIMKNLLEIHKNDKTRIMSFMIRTNITKANADEVDVFFEFFDNLLENDSRFIHVPQVAWSGNDADTSLYYTEEVNGVYEKLSENLKRDFKDIDKVSENMAMVKLELVKARMKPCKSGKRNHLGIMPDGTLHMCEPHYNEKCSQVGYLKEDGTTEFNEQYIKWVTGAKERNRECYGCTALPICLSAACPYRMSIKKEKSACENTKESINQIISIFSKNEGTCPLIKEDEYGY